MKPERGRLVQLVVLYLVGYQIHLNQIGLKLRVVSNAHQRILHDAGFAANGHQEEQGSMNVQPFAKHEPVDGSSLNVSQNNIIFLKSNL